MYAQLSTGQAARAQHVVGVPPSSCLAVVSQVFFSSTGNTTAVQF